MDPNLKPGGGTYPDPQQCFMQWQVDPNEYCCQVLTTFAQTGRLEICCDTAVQIFVAADALGKKRGSS
jgi:hypothetical protein